MRSTQLLRMVLAVSAIMVAYTTTAPAQNEDPIGQWVGGELKKISGESGINCGEFLSRHSRSEVRAANKCVTKAIREGKPFRIWYTRDNTVDSSVYEGLAGDPDGLVFFVHYDTLGPALLLSRCENPVRLTTKEEGHPRCLNLINTSRVRSTR